MMYSMPRFGFIPMIVLVLTVVALAAAALSKSRGRVVTAVLFVIVVSALIAFQFAMLPDQRFGPRRSPMRFSPYRGAPEPAPSVEHQTITAAENEAMLRMLQSMPAPDPAPAQRPAPQPPLDLVLPTDPPRRAPSAPATEPATQPSASGKPWVDDWASFASSLRPDQLYLRTDVQAPAVDPDEARQLAVDAAVRSLRPVIAARMTAQRPGAVWNQAELDRQLRAGLDSGQLIADQFVQRVDKPYGTLWKHQLLLDASPSRLDPIARRASSVMAESRTRQISFIGSVAGMAAVIVLLCLFLNFVTRGYFVWRLRAAAVMVVVAALLAAMVLA
jgi:hypothetical protein